MTELQRNKRIAEQIERIISSKRSVHAFLFVGGSSESRSEIGMWLSKKVLCKNAADEQKFEHGNSEDFILLEKKEDRETILKEQVLELIEKLSYKPFNDCYAVLIKDAHLMNEASQNKLLKTLEEPVSPAVIILLSESKDAIRPTVRSRCTCFYLEEEKAVYSEEADSASRVFAGLVLEGPCYYKKKNAISYILKEKDNTKSLALEFLDALEERLEEYILKGDMRAGAAVSHVEKARMYIKQGHSCAYSLKQLCLRA